MKNYLLYRYIFWQFWQLFFFALMAIAGIFWIGQSVALIEAIILKREGIGTFFSLSVLLLPSILRYITPIAGFIAAILLFLRLHQDAEWVVMHGGGFSPNALLRPIYICGVLVTVGLYFIFLFLAPWSTQRLYDSLWEIDQNFSQNIIIAKRFISPVEGIVIFVDESIETGEVISVFIDDSRDDNIRRQYYAAKAFLLLENNERKLALINGEYHEKDLKNSRIANGSFDRLEINFGSNSPELPRNPGTWERSTSALIVQYQNDPANESRAFSELVERFSYPLYALALIVFGAVIMSTRSFRRRGYAQPLIFSTLCALLFQAIGIFSRDLIFSDSDFVFLAFFPIIVFIASYGYVIWHLRIR